MEYKDIKYLEDCIKPLLPICLDHCFTEAEQIAKLTCAVNDLIKNDEYFNEILKQFLDEFDTNLETVVLKIMNEWLDSGKISLIFNKLFNTFAEASENNLKNGDVFSTCGFYQINDGGNATYIVKEDGVVSYNNLNADVVNSVVNPIMYGAHGDGVSDDTNYVQNCINDCYDFSKTAVFVKKYAVNMIEMTDYAKIDFNNCELIGISTSNISAILSINIEYQSEDIAKWNDACINNISIHGNSNSNYDYGVYINARSLNINTIFIKRFAGGSSVYIKNYDGVTINNITSHSDLNNQGDVGVHIERADTYYNNIEVSNYKVNVLFETSNDIIVNNLHSWHSEVELKSGIEFRNGPGNIINNYITDGDAYPLAFLSDTDNGYPMNISNINVFNPSAVTTLISCQKFEQLQNIKIGTLINFRDGTKLTNIVDYRQLPSIANYSNNMRFGLKFTLLSKEITMYQYNGFLILNGTGTHQLTLNVESESSSFNLGKIDNLSFPPLDTTVGAVDVYGATSYELKSSGYLYIDIRGNLTILLIKNLGLGEHIVLIKDFKIPLLTY